MRLQTLTALVALSLMSACAPFWAKPDLQVSGDRCISEATAAIQPTPRVPDGAGFPAPVSEAEKQATDLYLEWLGEFGAVERERVRRLTAIRSWCDSR